MTIQVDPDNVREFKDAASFYKWLGRHHDKKAEVWIKIHKVNSGLKSITPKEAIDVALCWGWIDAVRKPFDAKSYLQRYTPRGGRIEFRTTAENGFAVFRFRDNGQGIPKEMLSRVFDLRTQVERSLETSGTGLGVGLALVRTLVELHGGTVAAMSEGPDRGSEFVVRLPLYKKPTEE